MWRQNKSYKWPVRDWTLSPLPPPYRPLKACQLCCIKELKNLPTLVTESYSYKVSNQNWKTLNLIFEAICRTYKNTTQRRKKKIKNSSFPGRLRLQNTTYMFLYEDSINNIHVCWVTFYLYLLTSCFSTLLGGCWCHSLTHSLTLTFNLHQSEQHNFWSPLIGQVTKINTWKQLAAGFDMIAIFSSLDQICLLTSSRRSSEWLVFVVNPVGSCQEVVKLLHVIAVIARWHNWASLGLVPGLWSL